MIEPLYYRHLGSHENRNRPGYYYSVETACPHCGIQLTKRYSAFGMADWWNEEFIWESRACLSCGWWWYGTLPQRSCSIGDTRLAILHKSPQIPDEVRQGLEEIGRDKNRLYQMPPTKFEQFVGGILGDFYDCSVEHCGKSHDGGIDLILLDSDAGKIPVQVKRRSRSESVESVSLIREFRGAMLLSGYSRGKIVTTADHFSTSAVEASSPKENHLVAQTVDLVDCRRLLDIMSLICTSRKEGLRRLAEIDEFGMTPVADVMHKIEADLVQFKTIMAGLP